MILFFPKNKLSRLVNVSIFSIACEKDRVTVNIVWPTSWSTVGEGPGQGDTAIWTVALDGGKLSVDSVNSPLKSHLKGGLFKVSSPRLTLSLMSPRSGGTHR